MPGPREESGMKDKGSHLPALCPEVWMVAGDQILDHSVMFPVQCILSLCDNSIEPREHGQV